MIQKPSPVKVSPVTQIQDSKNQMDDCPKRTVGDGMFSNVQSIGELQAEKVKRFLAVGWLPLYVPATQIRLMEMRSQRI